MGFFDEQLTKELEAQEPTVEETPEPVIEKYKIGEEEITADEYKQMKEAYALKQELEGKWNTSIDKVYPDYTKKTQQLKEAQEELDRIKSQVPPIPQDEEQAIKEAREAAKRLGILTTEDTDYLNKVIEERIAESQRVQAFADKAMGLEKQIDGTDGRPRFDAEKVITFMRDSGIADLETAYEVLNKDDLAKWRSEQISRARSTGIPTSQPSGFKVPEDVRVTRDNLEEMMREALNE